MPIKSFIVFPKEGCKNQLVKELEAFETCEVTPSTNEEILVLVTDTASKEDEDNLIMEIESLSSVNQLALVTGYED